MTIEKHLPNHKKREFNALIADIDFKESEIDRLSEEITNLEDDRVIKRHNSAELQSKLIREGDMMSADELVRLNERKTELDTVLREADDSLKIYTALFHLVWQEGLWLNFLPN